MSTQDTKKGFLIGGLTPVGGFSGGAIGSTFGGRHKGQSSWQSGSGFNGLSPEEIALLLGTQAGQIGYDSNQKGSFESTYNNILNSLDPEILVKRYSNVNQQDAFQTGLDRLQKSAYDSAKAALGRDLTGSEFSLVLPAFQGPNGLMNGRAYVAQLAQQYKLNPAIDPMSEMNRRNPAEISSNVSDLFRSILGREASGDELSHFTDAIRTNQIDAYGLASFLKTQPEYTNKQDQQFRSGLNEELTKYDTEAFNRQKGDIISAYGRNGMAAGFDPKGNSLSPSLDYALTDLMGKIASNRSAYLAQLSASQYGGNKQLATDNYRNTLDQMYGANQDRTNRMNNFSDTLMNRAFQGADYQTQRNDFMDYVNNIPKQKPNFFDYLNTGANVARGIGSIGAIF